jgi:hypothetical protein
MAFQTLAIGFVMSDLNTAVEKSLILFIPIIMKIGFIKTHTAGAVFFAANSIIIGLIIYVPLIF